MKMAESVETQVRFEAIQKEVAELKNNLPRMDELFAQAEDVHLHTSTLGGLCRSTFLRVDDKYELSKSVSSFEQICGEILDHTKSESLDAVQAVLGTIAKGKGSQEAETGLIISDLLVRTWRLACRPDTPHNARDLVIQNLEHNILANGGCPAGIAGRLIQPYAHFTTWALERGILPQAKQEAQFAKAIGSSASRITLSREDRELQEALARSMATEEKKVVAPTRYEDEMARAIALSMQQAETKATSHSKDAMAEALTLSRLEEEKRAETHFDEELQRALALSMDTPPMLNQWEVVSQHQPNVDRPMPQLSNEDEDLQKAIIASLNP